MIVIYRVTVHFVPEPRCKSFDMPLSIALHHAHNIVSTLMAARFAHIHVHVVRQLCTSFADSAPANAPWELYDPCSGTPVCGRVSSART